MGLDQYLFKIKRKYTTQEDLDNNDRIRSMFDDPNKTKYYDDVKNGNYDKYLEDCFYENYAKSVKVGLIIKNGKTSLDKAIIKNLEEDSATLALDAANKFLDVYVKNYLLSVELYKESVANGESEELYDPEEIGYWRKHADLQGYMENIYRQSGGKKVFNCIDLILSKTDCENIINYARDNLKKISKDEEVEHTTGFFFGSTYDEDWVETINVFSKVLEKTDWDKETIYYSSWW